MHAPVNSQYGGMYVTTEGATAWPFYGYRAGVVDGSEAAWTYLDGNTGDWHLNVGGNRLTVTDEGNVGIGITSPTNRLQVLGLNPNAFTGYFQGSGIGATALVGHNASGAGTTYGVRGRVDSTAGYAGYFQGGRNYFEGNVGIGTTDPAPHSMSSNRKESHL